jgi:hypothetical protein
VRCTGLLNFPHHAAHHFLLAELRGIEVAAIPFGLGLRSRPAHKKRARPALTRRWRRESVSCKLVSGRPNSLLAGKIQGISGIISQMAREIRGRI